MNIIKPFQITEHTVAADIPDPIVFALVTDLHNKSPREIVTAIEERGVDFIAVSGDIINFYEDDAELVPQILTELRSVARVFYVTGNHDLPQSAADEEIIRETGVIYLDHEYGMFRFGRSFIKIGGLPTIYDTSWLDAFSCGDGFKLLLCHHPEYYPELIRPRNIDLTVSGHAHGGQWRLFGRGAFAPGQGLLPKYTSGMYESRLIVSRGLENNAKIPRINDPYELPFITLKPTTE